MARRRGGDDEPGRAGARRRVLEMSGMRVVDDVRAIDRHCRYACIPPGWPSARGDLPNEYGVFVEVATEILVYPDDTRPLIRVRGPGGTERRRAHIGGTSCELRLVELAGGAWCYGYTYTLRDAYSGGAPSVRTRGALFESRRDVIMDAYGWWQRTAARASRRATRHEDWISRARQDAEQAQRVADWLLTVAGKVRRGGQMGLFS